MSCCLLDQLSFCLYLKQKTVRVNAMLHQRNYRRQQSFPFALWQLILFCLHLLPSSGYPRLRLFSNDPPEGCDLLKSCHVAAAQNFEWVLVSSTSVERGGREKTQSTTSLLTWLFCALPQLCHCDQLQSIVFLNCSHYAVQFCGQVKQVRSWKRNHMVLCMC